MKQTKQFVRKLLWIVAWHFGLGAGFLEAHPGHVGHGISGSSGISLAAVVCAVMVIGVVLIFARGVGGRRGAAR